MRSRNGTWTSSEPLLVPLDYEFERSGRRARAFLIALLLFLVLLIAVLAIAPMREVAQAQGEIRPVGDIVELRHVDGGSVSEIHVGKSASVARGDVLMRLRPLEAATDLRRLVARREHLELTKARMTALLGDVDNLTVDLSTLSADSIGRATDLLVADRRSMQANVEQMRGRAEQKRHEASTKRREAESLAEEMATYGAQIAIREELVSRGAAAATTVLDLKAQRAEAKSRQLAILGQAEAAELAAVGVDMEIAQLLADRRVEWLRQLNETQTELSEVVSQIAKQADRLERLTIRSPIDGVVQSVGVESAGSVVAPGGVVASIVPEGEDVVAEVRVSPDDIGHIELGHTAFLRVTTFDSEIFGEITGKVAMISPTSFQSEQGERYFLARLELDRTQVDLAERQMQLTPGMVVNAEIKTGAKSVLRYLFKPVVRALDKAFAER